jgi:hypothetical protein
MKCYDFIKWSHKRGWSLKTGLTSSACYFLVKYVADAGESIDQSKIKIKWLGLVTFLISISGLINISIVVYF